MKHKRSKIKKNSGAVSIFLVLMLAVMLPLILTMIEGARISAMKTAMECAADLSLDSALAEYNRELLRQYDLLFIDTAYCGEQGSLENTKDHMIEYVNENLDTDGKTFFFRKSDMLGLELEDIEFSNVSRATDDNGSVFRYMALSYMLEKYGIDYVKEAKDLCEKSESSGLFKGDIKKEEADAQKKLDDYEFEHPQVDDGNGGKMDDPDWEEPEKADPAENINKLRSKGILSLVCKGEISGKSTDLKQYASQRDLVKGDGMCSDWDERNGVMYDMLFNEYILCKCGNYTKKKDGSLLDYEAEYIIVGKNNDNDNLKAIANRLLLIRGASNSIYFFTDAELTSAAEAMAAALAAATLTPELEPIYKPLICAAWIYAESLSDVREIFNGKKVPLYKQKGEWKLSLEGALGMTAQSLEKEDGNNTGSIGFGYMEYMRIFMYSTGKDTKTKRMMDIVEMDIRQQPGYEHFRLDNCIAAATVQFSFKSSYGYEFLVTRKMRYM